MNLTQRSCVLPWERGATGKARSLQRWLRWLQNPSIPPRKRILETIQSGHIPAHLLHHFACNGYEARFRSYLPLLPKFYTQILQDKRDWIEGLHSSHILQQHLDEIPFHRCTQDAYMLEELERLTRALLSTDPLVSARYCSAPHPMVPEQWLCQTLHDALAQFLHHRERLLQLLLAYKAQQDPTLCHWSERLEEVLFVRE